MAQSPARQDNNLGTRSCWADRDAASPSASTLAMMGPCSPLLDLGDGVHSCSGATTIPVGDQCNAATTPWPSGRTCVVAQNSRAKVPTVVEPRRPGARMATAGLCPDVDTELANDLAVHLQHRLKRFHSKLRSNKPPCQFRGDFELTITAHRVPAPGRHGLQVCAVTPYYLRPTRFQFPHLVLIAQDRTASPCTLPRMRYASTGAPRLLVHEPDKGLPA